MKFKDIEPIQHPSYPLFDKQWRVEFENGNGLSIVKNFPNIFNTSPKLSNALYTIIMAKPNINQ